jgi:predicted metal-dependent HD superfamily phosphohydrolase
MKDNEAKSATYALVSLSRIGLLKTYGEIRKILVSTDEGSRT